LGTRRGREAGDPFFKIEMKEFKAIKQRGNKIRDDATGSIFGGNWFNEQRRLKGG